MNLLLDLDGTLTDPREGILACIRFALDRFECVAPADVELLRFIGPPLTEAFRELLAVEDAVAIASAVAAYRERFATLGMFENAVYPGIPQALAQLHERGVALFVATTKPWIFAEQIVEHFGLSRYFTRVYGSELDGTRADKGDLIAHILRQESLDPAHTAMVGDRSYDVQGAIASGVLPVGVLWGYGSEEELRTAGAVKLLTRPEDIAQLLI
jgi:phosphoglycolate phosphatase